MLLSMLTTVDNPFDPFDESEAWEFYDRRAGYNTMGFLARVLQNSTELSDADQHLAIESAISEIVKENVSGIYRKVTKEFPDLM